MRPKFLNEIVGQEEVVKCLEISINGAKQRYECLPNILFDGPPGIGKTTLALALANEMNTPIEISNGANLRTIKKLVPYLLRLQRNSILFIDEIHRTSPVVQEILYPVLEDFRLDTDSDDIAKKSLPKFTLIGATTEAGSLVAPFYDRFALKFSLKIYKDNVLAELVRVRLRTYKIEYEECGVSVVVNASRGTPRIANKLIDWLRDYLSVSSIVRLTQKVALEGLSLLKINKDGYTESDMDYLKVLSKIGKPVGINTLVSATNISKETIENVIEPFLIRKGRILKTIKGRILV